MQILIKSILQAIGEKLLNCPMDIWLLRSSTATAHYNNRAPYDNLVNGWQLAKMKKSIPDMSLP